MVRQIVLVLGLLVGQVQAQAVDPAAEWRGVKVMPKLNAEVKSGDFILDQDKLSLPWVVQDINDDAFYVGDHEKGWVKRSEVVTLGEASAFYTSFIERGEHLAWAYDHRAISWALSGKLDLAIADFGEELRLQPSSRAYVRRGLTFDLKEKIRQGDRGLRLSDSLCSDPNDARAFRGRGIAWLDKNDNDKAIDDFNRTNHLDPNDAAAYDNRGIAWLHRKNPTRQSLPLFDQAIRLDPNNARAYCNRRDGLGRKE